MYYVYRSASNFSYWLSNFNYQKNVLYMNCFPINQSSNKKCVSLPQSNSLCYLLYSPKWPIRILKLSINILTQQTKITILLFGNNQSNSVLIILTTSIQQNDLQFMVDTFFFCSKNFCLHK